MIGPNRYAAFAAQHKRPLLAGAWLLASAILWIAIRRVDWASLLRVVIHARFAWLFTAIVLNALVLPVWAAAWYALWRDAALGEESRPPRAVLFEINALTSAMGNTVPFMLGATTTAALLARRGGLGTRGAITLIAFDQVFEGLAKVALFGFVAFTMPLPVWMNRGILLTCLGVGAVLIGVALVYRVLRRRQTVIPAPLSVVRGMAVCLCFLAMKGLEILAIVAVQRSLGLSLPLMSAPFILAIVLLGTMVPVAPASVGPYELMAVAGYQYLGVTPDLCVALALLQHACFLLPAIGTGYIMLSVRAIAPRLRGLRARALSDA